MQREISDREWEVISDLRAVVKHGHGGLSSIKVADHKIMNWEQTFAKR